MHIIWHLSDSPAPVKHVGISMEGKEGTVGGSQQKREEGREVC